MHETASSHTNITTTQALRYFTCNNFKILPIKIAVSPQILLHLVNYYRYHVVLPPNPVCELVSKGEHNCMLKRLRNGHPVLLNLCFLCGLIVETCSHAVL